MPYMIFERKEPFTQLSPRLTSAFTSPWVATTRLSRVATITLHPVPQNRQGALFQSRVTMSASVTRLLAEVTIGRPAAAAAMAAAWVLTNARRVMLIQCLLRARGVRDRSTPR